MVKEFITKTKILFICLQLVVLSSPISSFADCRSDYHDLVAKRLEKLEKYNHVAEGITGTAIGGTTLFMGTMGVLLVGPMGVLIGLQFGVLASLVGLPLWAINKIKKARIAKLAAILQLLDESYGLSNNTMVLNSILKRVRRHHGSVDLAQLKTRIIQLDENRDLCNGTIAQYKKIVHSRELLATPNQVARFLEDNF